MLQSSAYRTKRCLRRSSSRSSLSSTMFDSSGESGPPCGVPSSAGLTSPFSNTPTFKNEVYHPAMASSDVLLRFGYRLMRRAFRPEPVAVFGEGRVPSALQNLHHRLLDPSIQHRRDTQLSHPAVRLRDFYPSHRLWLVGPAQQLFPYGGPVLLQVARELSDFPAVDPRTPFVRFDSLVSLPAVSPRADFFHQLLVTSWTFGFAFRRERFGPFLRSLRSFTPPLLSKGQH